MFSVQMYGMIALYAKKYGSQLKIVQKYGYCSYAQKGGGYFG